ncbi:MAG: hypothetical protein NT065_06085 [Chlamydiae bacterium]|nr:hypothetical protein [Chlamydiota bacterium]
MDWLSTIAGHIRGLIAIEGKTLCDSGNGFRATKPVDLVNAFTTENQLVLVN